MSKPDFQLLSVATYLDWQPSNSFVITGKRCSNSNSEENRRNAKGEVGGVANGKMGVGEASEASSHRVGEEDTIGSHSEYKDKDTRSKGNFPRIKKKSMIMKAT